MSPAAGQTGAQTGKRQEEGFDPLRPERLSDFTGQPDVARELGIILSAAKADGRIPPHVLLAGPPGRGKTTLAMIVANELGLPLIATSGPAIEKPSDIASLMSSLGRPSVVFIDEIHAVPRLAEELLYSAMEDGKLDIPMGQGASARFVRLPLPPFVLVGATTRSGRLSEPLRMRFVYTGRLRPYQPEDLARIVERSAGLLGVTIDSAAALVIAQRSQATPRVANNNLRKVRDYASAEGEHVIDASVAAAGLDAFNIDVIGLDYVGREILKAICIDFHGGPVGLKSLATAVNEDERTLEDEYEPFLRSARLITRTPRGRVATAAAYEHLGLAVPASAVVATMAQDDLFGQDAG